MQTLLIFVSSAFGVTALAWFFTWALWIHPPEGWFGGHTARVMAIWNSRDVRQMTWFKILKIATVILGVLALSVIAASL